MDDDLIVFHVCQRAGSCTTTCMNIRTKREHEHWLSNYRILGIAQDSIGSKVALFTHLRTVEPGKTKEWVVEGTITIHDAATGAILIQDELTALQMPLRRFEFLDDVLLLIRGAQDTKYVAPWNDPYIYDTQIGSMQSIRFLTSESHTTIQGGFVTGDRHFVVDNHCNIAIYDADKLKQAPAIILSEFHTCVTGFAACGDINTAAVKFDKLLDSMIVVLRR
jgi:hypothetical protein